MAELFIEGVPDKTTGPTKEMLPLVVVTAPEKFVEPAPVCVKEPEGVAVPAKVNRPLFRTVIEELAEV